MDNYERSVVEAFLNQKIKELWKEYKKIVPVSKCLHIYISNDGCTVNNEYWDDERKTPVRFIVTDGKFHQCRLPYEFEGESNEE